MGLPRPRLRLSILTGSVQVSHFLTIGIARKYGRTSSILGRNVCRHITQPEIRFATFGLPRRFAISLVASSSLRTHGSQHSFRFAPVTALLHGKLPFSDPFPVRFSGVMCADTLLSPKSASLLSGCRESNSNLTNPNRVYYHCTTARCFYFFCRKFNYSIYLLGFLST